LQRSLVQQSGVYPGPGLAGGIESGGANGNTSRDFLRAPGYRDVDMGLECDFHVRGSMAFAFRADVTNVFNMVSLNAPTATLSSSIDGHVTAGAPNRIIQLGVTHLLTRRQECGSDARQGVAPTLI